VLEALLQNYYDIAHDYDVGDYLSISRTLG